MQASFQQIFTGDTYSIPNFLVETSDRAMYPNPEILSRNTIREWEKELQLPFMGRLIKKNNSNEFSNNNNNNNKNNKRLVGNQAI